MNLQKQYKTSISLTSSSVSGNVLISQGCDQAWKALSSTSVHGLDALKYNWHKYNKILKPMFCTCLTPGCAGWPPRGSCPCSWSDSRSFSCPAPRPGQMTEVWASGSWERAERPWRPGRPPGRRQYRICKSGDFFAFPLGRLAQQNKKYVGSALIPASVFKANMFFEGRSGTFSWPG